MGSEYTDNGAVARLHAALNTTWWNADTPTVMVEARRHALNAILNRISDNIPKSELGELLGKHRGTVWRILNAQTNITLTQLMKLSSEVLVDLTSLTQFLIDVTTFTVMAGETESSHESDLAEEVVLYVKYRLAMGVDGTGDKLDGDVVQTIAGQFRLEPAYVADRVISVAARIQAVIG